MWTDCRRFVTASGKHECVHIVTENISAILFSASGIQQQFLLFSVISHKQLWLQTGVAHGYHYDVTFFRDGGTDVSDKPAARNLLIIIGISLHDTTFHKELFLYCDGNKGFTDTMSLLSPKQNKTIEEVHRQTCLIYYAYDRAFCVMCPSLSFRTSTDFKWLVMYNLNFGIPQNILTHVIWLAWFQNYLLPDLCYVSHFF